MRACSAGNSSSHSGANSVTRDHLALRQGSLPSGFAAAHVRATISGVYSRWRTWATTASSISAAGTLRTGQPAWPWRIASVAT